MQWPHHDEWNCTSHAAELLLVAERTLPLSSNHTASWPARYSRDAPPSRGPTAAAAASSRSSRAARGDGDRRASAPGPRATARAAAMLGVPPARRPFTLATAVTCLRAPVPPCALAPPPNRSSSPAPPLVLFAPPPRFGPALSSARSRSDLLLALFAPPLYTGPAPERRPPPHSLGLLRPGTSGPAPALGPCWRCSNLSSLRTTGTLYPADREV